MAYAFCPRCASPLAVRHDGERDRATCPREGCGFVHYDNPLPVVAAIVEREGSVVLVRQPSWPEKMFGLVTGFLEKGESPERGVLRELKEELGLDGTVERLVGVYPFEMRNELIVAYHVRAAPGPVVLGAELAAYKEVPIGALRPWPFGTGLAVADWLAERAG
jgi:NADH pyrophosphatase NudC (nudix superfamily)